MEQNTQKIVLVIVGVILLVIGGFLAVRLYTSWKKQSHHTSTPHSTHTPTPTVEANNDIFLKGKLNEVSNAEIVDVIKYTPIDHVRIVVISDDDSVEHVQDVLKLFSLTDTEVFPVIFESLKRRFEKGLVGDHTGVILLSHITKDNMLGVYVLSNVDTVISKKTTYTSPDEVVEDIKNIVIRMRKINESQQNVMTSSMKNVKDIDTTIADNRMTPLLLEDFGMYEDALETWLNHETTPLLLPDEESHRANYTNSVVIRKSKQRSACSENYDYGKDNYKKHVSPFSFYK